MTTTWITVWLDQTYESASVQKSDIVATHHALCKIDPYLITFRNVDTCIDYITDINDDESKVILIISHSVLSVSSTINALLQLGEMLPAVDSVYVLCFGTHSIGPLDMYSIVKGVYMNQLESFCTDFSKNPNIRRHRRRSQTDDDFSVSSLLPRDVHLSNPPSFTSASTINSPLPASPLARDADTNRQEVEFMYSQFLRDILIELESTEEEMINYCRQKCAGIEADQHMIDEFKAYYVAEHAIMWYTRETFLYRLLNKALREQDIDTLYALRYFIKDLHLQLKERYSIAEQQQTLTSNLSHSTDLTIESVYRGQLMNKEEFEKKISHNTGGFFSVYSFLSTTPHKNVASIYAGDGSNSSEASVLFQIDIDKSVNKFPYADVTRDSLFGDAESEILFTMGAVFRILSIGRSSEGFWNVHLKLTGEEDEELRILTEHVTKDIIYLSPLYSLAKLMLRMGNYSKAEQYYLSLLQNNNSNTDTQNILKHFMVHNDLGTINQAIGNIEKAIEHYLKSLHTTLQPFKSTAPFLSPLYNNLGECYRIQGDYDAAITFYHEALNNDLQQVNSDQCRIAYYYNNIGAVYTSQKHYSEALKTFEKSLEIRLKMLPANHPDLAQTYNNIAFVYSAQHDEDKAFEYQNKVLQIHLQSLPPNHPHLAVMYNNIGQTYLQRGDYDKAIENSAKAISIQQNSLPPNHPDLAVMYNNISKIYCKQGDYDTATEYINKALLIQMQSLSQDHLAFATSYKNLAIVLLAQRRWKEALSYMKMAYLIHRKHLLSNDPLIQEDVMSIAHMERYIVSQSQ